MRSGLSQNFWVNFAGFQLAWWSAILLTANSLPILILLLGLHLVFHRSPRYEFCVLLACGLTGFAVDLLLTAVGFFRFGEQLLPPLWLLLLWFCFAATFRHSLRFFQKRWVVASLCGGLFASLTYVGAAQLGAVTLGQPVGLSLLILLFIWMVLFPLLIWLSTQRFIGEIKGAH